MLLDQSILAMEGDGVKIQVEGMTARQTETAHGVEPAANRLRGDEFGSIRQLYSVKNDRLGMTFNPAKRANPGSKTTLMTWP